MPDEKMVILEVLIGVGNEIWVRTTASLSGTEAKVAELDKPARYNTLDGCVKTHYSHMGGSTFHFGRNGSRPSGFLMLVWCDTYTMNKVGVVQDQCHHSVCVV